MTKSNDGLDNVSTSNIPDSNIKDDIFNLYSKIKNIENYYSGIMKLISIYFKELENYLENKDKKDEIENLLSINTIYNYIKKLNGIINSTSDNIVDLIYIYDILINIHSEILNFITYINIFNIYDEITLLSDTSKNNINQNKIVILDTYKKLQKKNIKILKNITNIIINNYILTYDSYLILHNIYLKHSNILDLYTNIIKNYLYKINTDTKNELTIDNGLISLIIYNNQLDKNKILIDYISTLKNIKTINNNNTNDFNYLFKNSKFIKNQNIVTKFTNFTSYKKFLSIQDVFLDIQNSNFKFKSNELNNNTLSIIQNIVNDYYKIERQYLNITLIEIPIDKFNYNYYTLLNSKFTLNKNIGINNKYINKTKTIITEDEYKYLEQADVDYKNEMYLSYFNKMININNFQLSKQKTNNLEILLESQYILIIKLVIDAKNFEFHIMKNNYITSKSTNNIYMYFKDIKLLLQNKPNYTIENYNLIRNEKIINNIEENNMLYLYQSKIASDYKNLPIIDNLELKNSILNTIKKSIKKIDQKTKDKNIDKIINIIIDELYQYIKTTNNIEFTSEIYLTYYSNIHKLVNKIKKELTDNYNDELLNNIDNILNNLYSNIITINYNVLDKYYLTQL